MSQLAVVLKNSSNFDLFYAGRSGDWDADNNASTPTTIKPSTNYTANITFSYSADKHGYLYFDFMSKEVTGGKFHRSFYVYVLLTHTSPGGAPKLWTWLCALSSPRLRQPNAPGNSDSNMGSPWGRLGVSDYGSVRNQVSFEIRKGDIPIDGLSDGSGHDLWMSKLLKDQPNGLASKPITYLHIPGTHDTATWKVDWIKNARNQDLNLYEQLRFGIRYFDLRVAKQDGQFWPFHGPVAQTGDALVGSFGELKMDNILGQANQWYYDTVDTCEFAMFSLRLWEDDRDQNIVNDYWQLIYQYFQYKAIPAPINGNHIPSLAEIKANTSRRFILAYESKLTVKYKPTGPQPVVDFFNSHVWGKGQGYSTLDYYDKANWKAGKESIVRQINKFIDDPNNNTAKRDRFFNAQCQITPEIDVSPRTKAEIMNPYIYENWTGSDKWLNNTNIITSDFPTGLWVERILWMNYHS